ncbi:MAG TPA: FimV/HubP family polar landmark protein, partial [Steroidobacteraceae bacterium]|nr:FimV/HubP family polar landmark protein [Steroidobacteraceae bacterium]
MVAKSLGRALALLMVLPSAAFAVGLGDIRLLSPLNAPLDAEIELLDVTPEEMQSLKAQLASRDTFSQYGLDWPVFLSSVQVRTVRNADGHEVIKLKSADAVTEPFITLLVEVNWARGRVVREYTMLLDPPVYTPGQSPAANAPVASPATGTGTREGSIAREADPPPATQAPAAATEPPSAPATKPTSHPRAVSSAAGDSPAAGDSAAAGSTHLIQRGETLSRIAASTSGSSANTPQARAWMLAIYQANPAAFDKNMNLMRSGAVLRIPESSQVAGISPSEAGQEIRRQYAAWRSSTPAASEPSTSEQGRLRLVTPSETAAAGAGNSGAQVQALQGRVKDLEGQLSESKRLLELRNAELAKLQAQLAAKSSPPAAAPAPEAAPAPAPAATPPVAATPTPAPTEEPPAKTEAAPAPPVAQEPAPAAEPAAAPPVTAKPPVPKPQPAAAESGGGSILDTLKEFWWAIALLLVALAGLIGLRAWRSRRQSEFDDSLGRLAVAGAGSLDEGFASGDTAPIRPLPASSADGAFLVEESGTHQRPRIPGGAAAAPAARHVSSD